jgi:arsenite methyltransferase
MILNSRLLANLLATQFRRPSGILGMYAARYMTGRNIPRTEWAMDKCDIRTGHVVLEIGFGPGYGLAMAAARATDGTSVVSVVRLFFSFFANSAPLR